jgi:outer membrane protein TolC
MRTLHLPGILRVAYKLLVNDRAKFAALLVGITFAVFLMIEMTSLFAGIIARASSTVINIGASMWIMDPAVQTVANTIPLPDYVLDEVRSIPSVKYAVPLSQSEHLLASLVGLTPAQWQAPEIRFADLKLPAELPITLPSEVVRQRPDILMAEAVVHAASANVGVATAAMLPSVVLSGNYSANSLRASNVLTPAGRAWSAGADATAPVFAGGSLWYGRKAALDHLQQADALYRQTVLQAFSQVADTLRAIEHNAEALKADEEAAAAASQALHLVQANYEAGLNTYLDVLNADAQYQEARIAELQANAGRYQDTVALYLALGGGWSERADAGNSAARSGASDDAGN